MFRNMRRKKQLLSKEDTIQILEQGTSGVLALSGDDGYPYTVPLSYVFHNGSIYFHSAVSGHKIDAVANDSRASFCVIGQDCVNPAEYTTYYKSAVVFGQIRILTEESRKRYAAEKLAEKYAPGDSSNRHAYIEKYWNQFCILELTIEHMTGKSTRNLEERQKKL